MNSSYIVDRNKHLSWNPTLVPTPNHKKRLKSQIWPNFKASQHKPKTSCQTWNMSGKDAEKDRYQPKIIYRDQCFPNFLSLRTIQSGKIFWRTKKSFKINSADHQLEFSIKIASLWINRIKYGICIIFSFFCKTFRFCFSLRTKIENLSNQIGKHWPRLSPLPR